MMRAGSDGILIVGDAAHAVHPISGMGASLALQDARALARRRRDRGFKTVELPPRV